ncbi:MAG TPA: 16S rRNA (uracil(1498)-N(3))-methyltransferase, partial [bacterium]|nr:16S rRNA (uracil(1498)-N(3))-methyltransferase [bacterium]
VALGTLAAALETHSPPSVLVAAATLDELGAVGNPQTDKWEHYPTPVRIAVGPEGGWSLEELALLAGAGVRGWHLPGVTLTTWLAASLLPALWRWGGPRNSSEMPRW